MNKQSERELELHRQFEFWDELTTLTRYLMVLFLGAAIQDYSFDGFPEGMAFNTFVFSVLANIAIQHMTENKLKQIIEERAENS